MNTREGQFDPIEFLDYARKRWRVTVISCGVAVIAAACASFVVPPKFTATASILIDPPAGNDPRASTAVSPVYLESLKTYEHFASSDSLFGQAIDRLRIRDTYPGIAPESLKRRVLKVSKPRDTKILEISATLANPVQAQALAQFVAEQTVGLSRSLEQQSESDVTEDARKVVEAAAAHMREVDREWTATAVHEPVDVLQAQVDSAAELSGRLQRELIEGRADLADNLAQKAVLAPSAPADEANGIERQIAAVKARIGELTRSLGEVKVTLQTAEALLEKRKADRERLESERKAALAHLESATTRLNEVRISSAWRGERLKIIDPSIVPQKPTSPNAVLLIASALLISLVASMFYTAAAFGFSRRRFDVEDAYIQRARR